MKDYLQEVQGRNLWNELFELRDKQREEKGKAVWLVKGKDIPWENNEQGLMKWYMHPNIKSTVINTQMVYVQKIPPGSRSGRLKQQGGQIVYIWKGVGYTVVDGQKHYWEKD